MIHVDASILAAYKFDPDMSFERVLVDIFNLFTFSGEYWRLSTIGQGVFSNAAIWIIDYIMAYTVMTAAIYLLSGWMRVTVLLHPSPSQGSPCFYLHHCGLRECLYPRSIDAVSVTMAVNRANGTRLRLRVASGFHLPLPLQGISRFQPWQRRFF